MTYFSGFSDESIQFLIDLKENNNRAWFQENKSIYEKYLLRETQDFVMDMGNMLEKIAPDIVAIPKVDKSIFRIYRDTRFSKNKLPYKTHTAVFMWEGEGKKLENPGFYLHLDPEKIFVGVGMYQFPKTHLQKYRDAVIDSRKGSALVKAIEDVKRRGNYSLGWKSYKKVPRGYDADHERSELLLYSGLGFHMEEPLPDIIHKPDFISHCFSAFTDMYPLHQWVKMYITD